jgi:hypothetical protein
MTLTTTLSEELNAIVEAHAESLGSTPTSALDDLIRRGAAQVDWREIRESVEDIRSNVLDTFAALDTLAPYTLANLQLLAHWAARAGSTKLDEITYAQEARTVGRATWDSHLAQLGVARPMDADE